MSKATASFTAAPKQSTGYSSYVSSGSTAGGGDTSPNFVSPELHTAGGGSNVVNLANKTSVTGVEIVSPLANPGGGGVVDVVIEGSVDGTTYFPIKTLTASLDPTAQGVYLYPTDLTSIFVPSIRISMNTAELTIGGTGTVKMHYSGKTLT